MQASQATNAAESAMAATLIQKATVSWGELAQALQGLRNFIVEKESGYSAFEQAMFKATMAHGPMMTSRRSLKCSGIPMGHE